MFKRACLTLALAPLLLAAAPPSIQSEDLGMVFRGAHPRVLGLDGAFSIALAPGRTLWSFGDTVIGRYRADGDRATTDMPFNTGAWINDADVLTGASAARFPTLTPMLPAAAARTHRVWPLDLVKAKGRLWHYYVTIAPTGGSGALDFEVVGTGVAAADLKGSGLPTFRQPRTLWPGKAPSFGASALVHGDWLYLYAAGGATHLARVPLGQLDDPKAYRYFAGDRGWVPDWHDAKALPGSGPEASVRWNAYLKSFVMIYIPPFGHRIEARFAPAPEGPWSEAVPVAPCQPAGDPDAMFYGAKQHVELDVEGGRRIFVTYNTNTPPARLEQRPDLYWPRLVRVTFSRDAGQRP